MSFNEFVERDLYLLSRTPECTDSSGARISLHVGLRVYLYEEDVSDEGKPTYLIATGVVERDDDDVTGWSRGVPWRCRIDEWGEIARLVP